MRLQSFLGTHRRGTGKAIHHPPEHVAGRLAGYHGDGALSGIHLLVFGHRQHDWGRRVDHGLRWRQPEVEARCALVSVRTPCLVGNRLVRVCS